MPLREDQDQQDLVLHHSAMTDLFFLTSLRNRRLNGVKIQKQLRDLRGVNISQWTGRRKLRERNMTPHPPATGPKLTVTNRQIRLRFATEHLDWNLNQWSSIMFS